MGHSHSSQTPPRIMSDLPWQDGHYQCTNFPALDDIILVKGNIFLTEYGPQELTAGQFGTAADEVTRATGKTAYNIQLTIKKEGQVYKAYGVVSEDGTAVRR